MKKMKKIGCSNISVILTLIGILPLVGGAFGLYKATSSEVEVATVISIIILTLFGLITCGYRSCLYMNHEYGEINKSIFFFSLGKKIFYYHDFEKIYIDIECHIVSTIDIDEKNFYSTYIAGNSTNIELTEFIKLNKSIHDSKCWPEVKELVNDLSEFTGLPVEYSEKVRSFNRLS